MHFALIADAYPPMKTSGAVQIRDLVAEFLSQGHQVTVMLPDSSLPSAWSLHQEDNLEILRLRAMKTKDVSYSRRALAEHLLSSSMYRNLCKSPLKDRKWGGIIWYSPSIFFGGLVAKLKRASECPSYLILRDIFPEWAVDMGLLKKGAIYRYFKGAERRQYAQADVIGVQTPSNLAYFEEYHSSVGGRVEVLNNWLSEPNPEPCSINIADSPLAGRKIFVYTGNIGIAQGMDILLDLAAVLKNDESIGFMFVGRGSAVAKMKEKSVRLGLGNILFYDEIRSNEIPSLLKECHVGLIALDPRHRYDNIPGKFLAYMQSGLPILGNINPGNDFQTLVEHSRVGQVVSSNSLQDLQQAVKVLLEEIENDPDIKTRCRELARSKFSAASAATQVADALSNESKRKLFTER